MPLQQHFLHLPSLAVCIQVDSVSQHFKKVGASIEFAEKLLSEHRVKIAEVNETVDTDFNLKSYTAKLVIIQESTSDPFGPTQEVRKDYATMLDDNHQYMLKQCISVMKKKKA